MKSFKFIRATEGENINTIYYAPDGSKMIKAGGSWAWRNNNPGNLRKGQYSRNNGCIGYSGGFAVFPTQEQGHAALVDLIKNGYKDSSLESMIKHYAPPKDRNKTARYLKFILSQLGIKNPKTMVRDLTVTQLEKLVKAIEQFEGWKTGKTELIPAPLQITMVMKNKKRTIVAYFVKTLGWVQKPRAIQLARQGKIDAVVAHSRDGNPYLKTRPDTTVVNNLKNRG
jgi:hypothetical protein